MNTMSKPRLIAGWVLLVLVAGLMLFAGSGKAFGFAPPEVKEGMAKYGLDDEMMLIGAGELISAILLLIPRTSSLGVLLTSSFWGGAICLHMSHNEPYYMQSIYLLVTWLGAWLRQPATLHSLFPPSP